MSTSGIALTLTPHRFPGLSAFGLSIFLLDLLCVLFITAASCCASSSTAGTATRAFVPLLSLGERESKTPDASLPPVRLCAQRPTMSFDWTHQFCLGCDKQTDGAT